MNGIKRQFSVTKTPQQNGVVERKNRTVVEMARTMIHEAKLSNVLWPQAIHMDVHILNQCLLRNNQTITLYQLWKGIPASVKHFRIFGYKCYIKRVDPHLGKLDWRTDDGIFVSYSCSRKAYKCYNFRLRKIVEAIHVTFDEFAFLKSKTRQKDVNIPDIYDKHRSDDEKDETEEVKADDSDRFTFNDEQYFSPSKSIIPTKLQAVEYIRIILKI